MYLVIVNHPPNSTIIILLYTAGSGGVISSTQEKPGEAEQDKGKEEYEIFKDVSEHQGKGSQPAAAAGQDAIHREKTMTTKVNSEKNILKLETKLTQAEKVSATLNSVEEEEKESVALVNSPQNKNVPVVHEGAAVGGYYNHLPVNMQRKIEAILMTQRQIVARSMEGYDFHPKLKAR